MPVEAPSPLSDNGITVRVPDEGDIDVLAEYAPGAVEHGIWLPTTGRLDVAPTTWATWFVQELRLGWTAFGGRYGGGLVAAFGDEPVAAYLNFIPHEPEVVELCYGVAPAHRGRGLASAAARLAADWALSAQYRTVELHISSEHAESQRVAAKAGFRRSRQVTKHVAATGESYEDIIFVRARAS
jgi:RimJ/RimL family protein N-acetyltransferase